MLDLALVALTYTAATNYIKHPQNILAKISFIIVFLLYAVKQITRCQHEPSITRNIIDTSSVVAAGFVIAEILLLENKDDKTSFLTLLLLIEVLGPIMHIIDKCLDMIGNITE